MKERKVSIIFKSLVILSLLAGILLNVINCISISAILSYYTLQSNIICLAMFIGTMVAISLKKNYRSSDIYALLKGGVVIAILVTAITYQIALVPNNFNMDIGYTMQTKRYWANLFVHNISPVMVVVDYLLFDAKGKFKYYYPFVWLFFPLNYVLYVYIYNLLGGRFFGIGGSRDLAYIFLDYNQIGYMGVVKSISLMAVFILGISYVLVFLDRRGQNK